MCCSALLPITDRVLFLWISLPGVVPGDHRVCSRRWIHRRRKNERIAPERRTTASGAARCPGGTRGSGGEGRLVGEAQRGLDHHHELFGRPEQVVGLAGSDHAGNAGFGGGALTRAEREIAG